MRYNLDWIIKQKGHFTLQETLIFPKEVFAKFSNINGLKDIKVQGTGNLDTSKNIVYTDLQITGCMLLPCALTLEEVEYPFSISCIEVFSFEKVDPDQSIHAVKNNIVDLTPVVFENIMLEIPMRVTSKNAKVQTTGKGWQLIDSIETNRNDEIDPRLAKLKEYFKDQ